MTKLTLEKRIDFDGTYYYIKKDGSTLAVHKDLNDAETAFEIIKIQIENNLFDKVELIKEHLIK